MNSNRLSLLTLFFWAINLLDKQMNKEIQGTDFLALVRTQLANERTFLAYFRTFAVLLSSGLAIIKIDALHELTSLGYFFVAASFVLILLGIVRFIYVKKH